MHDATGFRLSADVIDTVALHARLDDPAAGACVVFEGRVRNHHADRAVLGLAYEAYAELAEAEGRRIVTAIRERHGLHRALCVHRVGALEIGDVAVWVGVSASHRDAAFVGCRAIIDAVKQDVPIWKHERYADGDAAWLHPEEGTGGR